MVDNKELRRYYRECHIFRQALVKVDDNLTNALGREIPTEALTEAGYNPSHSL